MFAVLKIGCMGLYLAALAGLFVELPFGATTVVQYAALFVLAAHVGEIAMFFGKVKLYKGPLIVSILLTVLFGFAHWVPLAQAQKQGA